MAKRKVRITVLEFQCERCGYQWHTSTDRIPGTCANPKCRSPYWDRPRRVPKVRETRPKRVVVPGAVEFSGSVEPKDAG